MELTEQEIERLLKHPDELTLFLEESCENETWADHHKEVLSRLLTHASKTYLEGTFSHELAKRIAQVVHLHSTVLLPLLPHNLTVNLEIGNTDVNAILFGTLSPYLDTLLEVECREVEKTEVRLPFITGIFFYPISQLMQLGEVPDLWKLKKEELFQLLTIAEKIECVELSKACQEVIKRYIDRSTVLELLQQAQTNHWSHLIQFCIDNLNTVTPDISIRGASADTLHVEFYRFSQDAFSFFSKIDFLITHLSLSRTLIDDPRFASVINQCPRLHTLDLTGTSNVPPALSEVRVKIKGLWLAQCDWLTATGMKQFVDLFPALEEISFENNLQLNSLTWGLLGKFRQLKKLSIARCHQINDEDFKLILRAFPGGTDLAMHGCKHVSQSGFFTLARALPRLVTLDVSRTSIDDPGFIEVCSRCRFLTHLDVSKCENLSEVGLMEGIRLCPSVKVLTVDKNSLSKEGLAHIRSIRPPAFRIKVESA